VGKRSLIACWAMLGLVTAVTIVTITTTIFVCTPTAYFWDKSINGGHCIDIHASFLSHAVLSMILDFMILILPMPIFWGLNLPKKQKIMLTSVFAVGGM
jgi:hypothetical protein